MRLTGLDALRGIAALCVLIHHLYLIEPTFGFFDRAYLAVDFFFMLSGYVMARTYEGRLGETISGTRFLWKRYKRFWPTMLVGGLLGLPLLYGTDNFAIIAALNLALLPTFLTRSAFPLNNPAWSIFFELFANAVHGYLAHRVRTRILGALVAVLAVVCALIAQHFNSLAVGAVTFSGGFPRVLLSYLIGVILWRTWRDNPPIQVPAIVTISLMPIAFLALSFARYWPLDLAFVLVCCPILIAGGLRLNAGRLGEALGAMSFPLYAVHFPILGLLALD